MSESRISSPFGRPLQSCIEIPYRDEGNGGGAFYDHLTIQKTTSRHTCFSVPEGMTTDALQSYVKTEAPIALPFGISTSEGKILPPTIREADRVGLLLITGHARETETKRYQSLARRNIHERELLRKAFLQGRPVMGICAGSWQIWSSMGGGVQDVKDHAWRRMPAITSKGNVGYNVPMHRVAIMGASMLAGAITDSQRYVDMHPRGQAQGAKGKQPAAAAPSASAAAPSASAAMTAAPAPLLGLETIHPAVELSVNSVHWRAPDPATLPRGFKGRPMALIAGTAKQDDAIAPQNGTPGTGAYVHPEADTVEVFEQEYGAPILGIQWHPEAYNRDGTITSAQHQSIVTYMAKAGDAFCAKREMVDSFEVQFNDMASHLRKLKLT